MPVRISAGKVPAIVSPEHLHRKGADRARTGLTTVAVDQQRVRGFVLPDEVNDLLRLRLREQDRAVDGSLDVVEIEGQRAQAGPAFVELKTESAGMGVLDRDDRVGVLLFCLRFQSRGIVMIHHIFKGVKNRSHDHSLHDLRFTDPFVFRQFAPSVKRGGKAGAVSMSTPASLSFCAPNMNLSSEAFSGGSSSTATGFFPLVSFSQKRLTTLSWILSWL